MSPVLAEAAPVLHITTHNSSTRLDSGWPGAGLGNAGLFSVISAMAPKCDSLGCEPSSLSCIPEICGIHLHLKKKTRARLLGLA